jgi:hypothetical protein
MQRCSWRHASREIYANHPAPRRAASLDAVKLERKRAHDREAQRAARARTRARLETLEQEVRELRRAGADRSGSESHTLQQLRKRNKLLENEVTLLRQRLQSVSRITSPFYVHEGPLPATKIAPHGGQLAFFGGCGESLGRDNEQNDSHASTCMPQLPPGLPLMGDFVPLIPLESGLPGSISNAGDFCVPLVETSEVRIPGVEASWSYETPMIWPSLHVAQSMLSSSSSHSQSRFTGTSHSGSADPAKDKAVQMPARMPANDHEWDWDYQHSDRASQSQ